VKYPYSPLGVVAVALDSRTISCVVEEAVTAASVVDISSGVVVVISETAVVVVKGKAVDTSSNCSIMVNECSSSVSRYSIVIG